MIEYQVHEYGRPSKEAIEKAAEQMRQYIRENVTQDDACKMIESCIELEQAKIAESNMRIDALKGILNDLRERPNSSIFKPTE